MVDVLQGKAFKEDCVELIRAFKAHNSTDFTYFVHEWKRMNFTYVFVGHTYDYELLQYTENYLQVLKEVFLSLSMPSDRIGALYLMYAMYFKQPTKEFCKFRFTTNEWDEMRAFYNAIYSNINYIQARMVFWRMWKANAFWFVEYDKEFGLEPMFSEPNRIDCAVMNFQSSQPQLLNATSMLKDPAMGLVTAMDILQAGYNEMKEHLAKSNKNCGGLKPSSIVEGITTTLTNIEDIFAVQSPRKKKRKPKTGIAKDSETELIDDDEEDEESDSNNLINEEINESSSEISDIGTKRNYLKHKAMNKSARSLVHGSSYNDAKSIESKSLEERTPPTASTSGFNNETGAITKSRKLVEYDNETGAVRIRQAASNRTRLRIANNSVVRKQFTDCPPELSAELDVPGPSRAVKIDTNNLNLMKQEINSLE